MLEWEIDIRTIKTKAPVYCYVLAITLVGPKTITTSKIGEKLLKPGHRYISRMFFILYLHWMRLGIFYRVPGSA